MRHGVACAVALALAGTQGFAQPPATQAGQPPAAGGGDAGGGEEGVEEIVVQGQREPGAVIGDIPADIRVDQAQIRSYGVSSVSELLAELTPQTSSGQGRGGGGPVVLLNGRRIGSFAEVRDLPTEAIQRLDILPEEVALKYGYRADQKVVNIVLRPRFRAMTVEGSGTAATEGGQATGRGQADLLKLSRTGRIQLNANYQKSGALTEAERDILPPAAGLPFATAGNIASATRGAQVDPRLAGTVVGVPASAATRAPTLADFAAAAANSYDPTPFRTLLPASDSFTLNGTWNQGVLGNGSLTLNGQVQATTSTALNGLPTVALGLPANGPFSPFAGPTILYRALGDALPLSQSSETMNTRGGFALDKDLAGWRFSLTGNYDRTRSSTITDTSPDTSALQARLDARDAAINPYGVLPLLSNRVDRARNVAKVGDISLLASGSPFTLPAGAASTSLRLGGTTTTLDSMAERAGRIIAGRVRRDIADAQLNLDLPILSARSPIGRLSINGNVQGQHLSDFGTQRTLGAGFNWAPVTPVRLIVSVSDEDGPPTQGQLGNPVIATPQVRVFDQVTGQTVTVTRTSGGNPLLVADNRRVFKAGLTVKPFTKTDLTLTANFTDQRIRNPIAAFPTPTAAIEAAFPGRFIRDAGGNLLSIDARPVNFARSESSELRWGVNFSKPLKSILQRQFEAFRAGTGPRPAGFTPPTNMSSVFGGQQGGPGGPGGPPPGGQRPGAGPGGPGGGGPRGPGGPGGGGGRMQFALYHTWHFTEEILIRPGVPVLDLLDGSAIGFSGGQPRHELEAQAGWNNNGLGVRLSANWQSGTAVRGGATDLNFSSLSTVDLRLFATPQGMPGVVAKHPWLRGTRLSVSIDNLFNERLRVRDAAGVVPIGYQPGYLDPLGRSIRVSLRKQFF